MTCRCLRVLLLAMLLQGLLQNDEFGSKKNIIIKILEIRNSVVRKLSGIQTHNSEFRNILNRIGTLIDENFPDFTNNDEPELIGLYNKYKDIEDFINTSDNRETSRDFWHNLRFLFENFLGLNIL